VSTCKIGALGDNELFTELDGETATSVAASLTAQGYPVSATTVKDHRAKRCACARTDVAAIIAPPADVPENTRQPRQTVPSGWQPRAEYDDTTGGFIVSQAWETGQPEPSEVDLLTERGMDPQRWQVTSVRYSDWEQSKRLESGDRDVITLHAKRVNIAPRTTWTGATDQDLAELFAAKRETYKAFKGSGNGAPGVFVHAGGDYQLGKTDGDGVDGTVQRFMDALDYGRERLSWLRTRHTIDTVCLPHLGDCIEGYVSQGGRNATRTTMATSEQVDLLIHLLCEQVAHYAPLADRVIVPVIPGNHDEEARNPDGLEHHSWATFAAKQLRRTLRMAGSAYDHVQIVTPAPGELTLALDLEGVPNGFGHGHYHGPGKLHDWLAGQAGGMQLVGEARIMWEAHHHHLDVSQRGVRTGIQVPALEGESRWWRHRKGEQSPPGMVTALVGEHLGRPVTLRDGLTFRTGWDHLAVA
jgi:hypothetical protein